MKIAVFASAAIIALAAGLGAAAARDQVQVAGSSTVLPYAKIVAESFGEAFPTSRPRSSSPVVRAPASSSSAKGVGEDKIDIANSSRAIKADEVEDLQRRNGVTEIQEVQDRLRRHRLRHRHQRPGFRHPARRHLQGSRRPGRR